MQTNMPAHLKKTNQIFSKLPLNEQLHGCRVRILTIEMAKKLDLDLDLESLSRAALYHDIGKTMVPRHILHKNQVLTEKEKKVMKEHSKWSGEIVANLKWGADLTVSVRHHHENYDGSGYPHGLKGAQIPLESRIIRVADAWDNLVSKPSYKDAYRYDMAMLLMEAEEACWDPYLFHILRQVV